MAIGSGVGDRSGARAGAASGTGDKDRSGAGAGVCSDDKLFSTAAISIIGACKVSLGASWLTLGVLLVSGELALGSFAVTTATSPTFGASPSSVGSESSVAETISAGCSVDAKVSAPGNAPCDKPASKATNGLTTAAGVVGAADEPALCTLFSCAWNLLNIALANPIRFGHAFTLARSKIFSKRTAASPGLFALRNLSTISPSTISFQANSH